MEKKLLIIIFLVGLGLRLVGLGRHPAGFTPDEASFGYDAYSLLMTGKDQWGRSYPLVLKSFGDGKMPLQAYLIMPVVVLFGLSEFSVRLPNALLGSLAVWVTYLLVKQWRRDEREALLAAALLAISPWHVPMSRGGFEANLTTFLMPLGIYLFLIGLKKRKWMYLSMLVFGLNLFSYHSARLVTPVVMGALTWGYRKELKHNFSTIFIFGFFVGLAVWTYLGGAGARVTSVSIVSLAGSAGQERFGAVMLGVPDLVARAFNNKLTKMLEIFVGNYVTYFSPQFLFTEGAREGTYGMLPGRGLLYLIELPLLIVGLGKLWKERIGSYWLFVWLLMAPVAAALAIGPGNAANRAIVMLPAVQIVLGIGGVYLLERLKKQKLLLWGMMLVWVVMFGFFIEDYFIQQSAQRAEEMIYGTREVFDYLGGLDDENVIISKSISEGHIYTAFYGKMEPEEYHEQARNWGFDESGLSWVDQLSEYHLGKYMFKALGREDLLRLNYLLVGKPGEFPENAEVVKKVYYPNKTEAFWVVKSGG